MVRARVAALLAPPVARLEVVSASSPLGSFDLLLVDLNRDAPARLAWLEEAVGSRSGYQVIAFGPHTEMADLNPRAKAAGASRCVANSHLAETLARWRRSQAGAAA